ncbi:MAG: histidinol dehydrogenase [Clostridia bacterium]|nr:histidinol dehydrogenase [Clostridia bacterium]
MIKILNTENINIKDILNRQIVVDNDADKAVAGIIENIANNGDKALFEYTEIFDKVKLDVLEVSEEERVAAFERCDKKLVEVIKKSAANIEAFHRMQLRDGFEIKKDGGIVLGQRITPIEKVGIYVPGGRASYPSTVLMNAIPAKIAGVTDIIMVSPPDKDGNIPDNILAAAQIAGVTRIFKVGGAQAIAALAYGTESVPKVDKIVGPGNVYVAAAKRRVFGLVNIDMIAGPSEILIISDKNGNPVHIAADMLSQAEHDPMASAVLVTDSEELASKVSEQIEIQLAVLPRKEICRTSIDGESKIIIAKNLDEAIDISNALAPEHLEIVLDNPFDVLNKIKNAGSIFLGKNCPEALGDYFAGPNHTLPTSGTARFSSPCTIAQSFKQLCCLLTFLI